MDETIYVHHKPPPNFDDINIDVMSHATMVIHNHLHLKNYRDFSCKYHLQLKDSCKTSCIFEIFI
jgi:hypothetical protein